MSSAYIDLFADNQSIIHEYTAPPDALDGAVVLLAWYEYENYSGQSLVIFEKDGKLFEVNGSHCSCFGLEGQWEPEETTWNVLAQREYVGSKEATDRLQELVAIRKAR